MTEYNPYDCSLTFEQRLQMARALQQKEKEKETKNTKETVESLKIEIAELKRRLDELEKKNT